MHFSYVPRLETYSTTDTVSHRGPRKDSDSRLTHSLLCWPWLSIRRFKGLWYVDRVSRKCWRLGGGFATSLWPARRSSSRTSSHDKRARRSILPSQGKHLWLDCANCQDSHKVSSGLHRTFAQDLSLVYRNHKA